jgi:hypothetical protein
MSEERDNARLDAWIDEAARLLTSAPAPADLRARVLTRIRAGEPSPARGAWLVPAAAAGLLAVVLALTWDNGFRGPRAGSQRGADGGGPSTAVVVTPPIARPGGTPEVPTPVAAMALPASGQQPAAQQAAAEPLAQLTELRPSAAEVALGQADVEILESLPPEGFESIAMAPTLLEPLPAEELTPVAGADLEPIFVESIELGALASEEGEL